MEFGLFIQNYVPNSRRAVDPLAEHHAIMEDIAGGHRGGQGRLQVRLGDRAPLPRRVLPPVGQRRRARPTSPRRPSASTSARGIFNPLPQVNHPAKVAERVAYLDHVSDGRFEFGTGRGAGSHEILGFLPGHRIHRCHQGDLGRRHRRVRQDVDPGDLPGLRRQVLEPAAAQDPAASRSTSRTRRCGTPPATRRATRWPAEKAWECWAFRSTRSRRSTSVLTPYRKAIANAEPVGAFVNDNIMGVIAAYVAEDSRDGPAELHQLRPELPDQQRLPLPRHDAAARGDPVLAGAHPGADPGDGRRAARRRTGHHRQPGRGARAAQALGGHRHRPGRASASARRRSRRRWRRSG